MENNNNIINNLKEIHNYLFPDEKLNLEIQRLNSKIASKTGKTILLWLIILFVAVLLIIVFLEEYQYVTATLVMYMVMLFMALNIMVINGSKKKVFKEQLSVLKIAETKYKKELIMHKNFKKYHLKWNVIYGLIIVLAMFFSVNLFITDLITTGNTTLGPIFASLVFVIVFFIPAAIVNFFDIKRYIKKQLIIIEQTI